MRSSRMLGALAAACAVVALAACVAEPVTAPEDPAIPGVTTPAFPNLTDPPTTAGPTDPPVPTTAPGTFDLGTSVTVHTAQGSTWEITPKASIDPANDYVRNSGAVPRNGERFVVLQLDIENVGVVTTHPYYDMMFAYQPDNAPMYDQNSAATAASPYDLGYIASIAPGERVSAEVVVSVPANAPTGSWVISGDRQQTFYRFEP